MKARRRTSKFNWFHLAGNPFQNTDQLAEAIFVQGCHYKSIQSVAATIVIALKAKSPNQKLMKQVDRALKIAGVSAPRTQQLLNRFW